MEIERDGKSGLARRGQGPVPGTGERQQGGPASSAPERPAETPVDRIADAVRIVHQARFGGDPEVLKQSPTMRYFAEMEARARDVYANEQGNGVGVNERAAQFIDKLVERAAQLDATRNVMVVGSRAVIEETTSRDRGLKEREEALRASPSRDSAELSALTERRKTADVRGAWANVPQDERARPLQREKTTDLMAAASVAAERESQYASSENRHKAEMIEQELKFRRVEVAVGTRTVGDLRPPESTGRDRDGAGVKLLNRIESKETSADRSASTERRIETDRKAEREAGIER